MKTYELTYIISSKINQEEVDFVKKEIESFIQSKQGVISTSEKTAPQTLAYLINKQSSGCFITLIFQILEDHIKEIKEKLEKNNKILRHLIIVKKPIKELKGRRIRKPLTIPLSKITAESPFIKTSENKKILETVDLNKIDEKIDEILNQ